MEVHKTQVERLTGSKKDRLRLISRAVGEMMLRPEPNTILTITDVQTAGQSIDSVCYGDLRDLGVLRKTYQRSQTEHPTIVWRNVSENIHIVNQCGGVLAPGMTDEWVK